MSDRRHPGVVSPADISVIIPVADRPELLRRCLAAIARSVAPPREIIVVSDAAGADVEGVTDETSDVRLIRLPFLVGTASARNAGALAAKGNVLFFIDADVEIRPDTIEQVAAAMMSNSQAAAIVGSYDDSPAAAGLVSQYRSLLNHFVHQQAPRETFAFWGACGAIRASAFNAVGGFDAGHHLDDVELGYRLRRAGYRIASCPEIEVKDLKRWTIRSTIRADLFYRAAPLTRILLSYPEVRAAGFDFDWADLLSTLFAVLSPMLVLWSFSWLPAASIALVAIALWLRVNSTLLRFLADRRGRAFAVRAIPLHWLHAILAGIGALLGLMQHAGGDIDRRYSTR